MYYGLTDDFQPYPLDSALMWAEWHSTHHSLTDIGFDEWIDTNGQEITVSTRFFGTDFGEGMVRCMWETMVFIEHRPEYQERYETYAQAITDHAATLIQFQMRYPKKEHGPYGN